MGFILLLVWQRGVPTGFGSEAYCREFDIRIGGFFSSFDNRHFFCKGNEICDSAASKPSSKRRFIIPGVLVSSLGNTQGGAGAGAATGTAKFNTML